MKSESLSLLQPSRPAQACNGIAFLFFSFTSELRICSSFSFVRLSVRKGQDRVDVVVFTARRTCSLLFYRCNVIVTRRTVITGTTHVLAYPKYGQWLSSLAECWLLYVDTQNGEVLRQRVLLDGWSVSCRVNIRLGRNMPLYNYVVKVIRHVL